MSSPLRSAKLEYRMADRPAMLLAAATGAKVLGLYHQRVIAVDSQAFRFAKHHVRRRTLR